MDVETLLTMPEIALLANVKRQAVTNWRSRPASTPFPAPVAVVGGVERFDRDEILDWLEATGRGRNSEARVDAPTVSAPNELDLERAVVLLTLRARGAEDIGPLTADERVTLAERVDPEDQFVLSEIREACRDDELADYVDELMAASFGPDDALTRLYNTRSARGPRGLAPGLVEILRSVAGAARVFLGPEDVAIELQAEPRHRQIAGDFQAAFTADRTMRRHLLLDGLVLARAEAPRVRVVSLVGLDDSSVLESVDEVALDLAAEQVAVVIGPSSVLCGPLTGGPYDARASTLRLGQLVASFKLPRGLWLEAHRASLGLWVMNGGSSAEGVLVGDLSGCPVHAGELADDVLGALGQTNARAYRYGRALPYNTVWTRSEVVPAGIGAMPVTASGASARERIVAATLITRVPGAGLDLALGGQGGSTVAAPHVLEDLLGSRAARLHSGCRIAGEHLDETGSVRIISADPSVPDALIDAFVAAEHYPYGTRTEPGDVVFTATPPHALVDESGGAYVRSPSRILRVDPLRASIGPRALAAAINQLATSSEWRTWPVPTIPRAHIQALEDQLGAIDEYQSELRRRQEAASSIVTNLIQGMADGSVMLGSATTEREAG